MVKRCETDPAKDIIDVACPIIGVRPICCIVMLSFCVCFIVIVIF